MIAVGTERAMGDAISHALAVYPRESVGYIRNESYQTLTNCCDDPAHFVVPVSEELAAYQAGMDLFVHSHPDGCNCPSESDMAHQEGSGVPWAIIVLQPPDKARPLPQFMEAFVFGAKMPVAPYEGRSFRHGVNDCYSLVRDWWRKERGVELPYFPRGNEWWKDGQNLIMDWMEKANFHTFAGEPEAGDVILMSVGHFQGKHLVNHMGVYVGNGLMLHHFAGRPSRRDPVHMYRQHHIISYARYRP